MRYNVRLTRQQTNYGIDQDRFDDEDDDWALDGCVHMESKNLDDNDSPMLIDRTATLRMKRAIGSYYFHELLQFGRCLPFHLPTDHIS